MQHLGSEQKKSRRAVGPYFRVSLRVFLLILCSVSFLPQILPLSLRPDLFLAYLVLSVCFSSDPARERVLSVIAVCGGALLSFLGGRADVLLPLVYLLIAVFLLSALRRPERIKPGTAPGGAVLEGLFTYFLALLPAAAVRTALIYLTAYFTLPVKPSLSSAALDLLSTLLFALPVFFLYRKRI